MPGVYWLMTLLGMSEKRRHPLADNHTGPSAHLNPSATLMILASAGINLSKRGSRRSIFPTASPLDVGGWPVIGIAKAKAAATVNTSIAVFMVNPRRAAESCQRARGEGMALIQLVQGKNARLQVWTVIRLLTASRFFLGNLR